MTIDIDAPLSSGIRRSKNFKNSPIKRSSTGGIKKRFSGAKPSGSVRRQSGGGRVPRRQSGSFPKEIKGLDRMIPSNDNREVRVNLCNLAPSVLSSDLRQLFAEFKIKNCSVNFNEKGAAAGTGDITLSKRQADRLIQKFAGVALDGKEMKFAIIDTTNIANRVKFPSKPQRVPQSAGKPRTAQRTPKKQGKPAAGTQKTGTKKTKKPKREEKPKVNVEELDAELDAYMAARAN